MSFMVRCGFDHGPRMDSPIRYRRLTQLWSSCFHEFKHPYRSRDGFLEFVPLFLNALNLSLHLSIYLFLAGLTALLFPSTTNLPTGSPYTSFSRRLAT